MPQQAAIAALVALLVWWSATGAILLAVRWADRVGDPAHGVTALCAVPLLALGIAMVTMSADGADLIHVYGAFLGALAVWGWIELAFLLGIVAGPERRGAPAGLRGWPRFARAWRTVAHHELALLAGFVLVAALAQGAGGQVAVWTYGILFGARILAKLNLFLGVPRINSEFLPCRLRHLESYFRQGPVTPFFPLTITALTCAAAALFWQVRGAESFPEVVAATLLAALASLALIEHWLMVLPLPDARLWRWMLPAAKPTPTRDGNLQRKTTPWTLTPSSEPRSTP